MANSDDNTTVSYNTTGVTTFPAPTDYELRSAALGFAIDTYSDNRSHDATVIISEAQIYEKYLKEVQNT